MRALSTSTRTGSAITDIALRELDKIASAKGEIDFGISPPPPLKAPVIPPPEKYECSLQKIEEGQTQSIEVADDKLGVIDIVERAYRKAKIERELHDE